MSWLYNHETRREGKTSIQCVLILLQTYFFCPLVFYNQYRNAYAFILPVNQCCVVSNIVGTHVLNCWTTAMSEESRRRKQLRPQKKFGMPCFMSVLRVRECCDRFSGTLLSCNWSKIGVTLSDHLYINSNSTNSIYLPLRNMAAAIILFCSWTSEK